MNYRENPKKTGRPAATEQTDRVAVLSDIYLNAGLPLEFAVRSAIADYQLFEQEILCAS